MLSRGTNHRRIISALLGVAALLLCATAAADPPERVARMANMAGPVTFSPAGEDEWTYATPNRPLVTGDRVWTDTGARAELQIGSFAVRMGNLTSVTILNLDDRVAQFQLAQGVLNVHVRRIDPSQTIEIDTPVLAFSLRRAGDYRIDVDAATGQTAVAVRSGEGEVYGQGAAYRIGARQWYRFADAELRDYQYDELPQLDAFDNWARDRDRREDRPVALRYVSPDVIGVADLDDYGTWSVVEGYGNVWVPTSVASDWAPYHHGHWTWIDPWGWTWVDDAPWGFAPFHYGRWAYARNRWCWVPGPVRARPVYAPALVAFIGDNNFRVSVGSGGPTRGVAWFPLAPGEVYRPAYRVSRNYFTNVNTSNTNVSNAYVTNAYNKPDAQNTVYRNRDQRGAIIAVPATAFVQSRPVAQAAVAVSRDVAAAAPVMAHATVAPVRASILSGGAGTQSAPAASAQGSVSRPPVANLQRPTVARIAPPPPPPPFVNREAALTQSPGRPADPATMVPPRNAVMPTAPVVKLATPAAAGTPPPAPTAPPRARTGTPASTAASPPAPGAAPMTPPRRVEGAAPPTPQGPPPALQPPPGRAGSAGGPPPRADAPPSPPGPPAGVRPVPTPVAPQAQPPAAPAAPPAPVERRRDVPTSAAPPAVNVPPTTPAAPPTAVERRRDVRPPAAPPTVTPPAATPPAPVERRRDVPAPPTVNVPAAPPAAVERRRDVPPPPAATPPAPVPPPQPAPVVNPRVQPPPPQQELRREPPPARAPSPPVVQPAPPPAQMVRPPAAAPAPASSPVPQPEAKAQPAPAKGEAQRGKADDKREDKRDDAK